MAVMPRDPFAELGISRRTRQKRDPFAELGIPRRKAMGSGGTAPAGDQPVSPSNMGVSGPPTPPGIETPAALPINRDEFGLRSYQQPPVADVTDYGRTYNPTKGDTRLIPGLSAGLRQVIGVPESERLNAQNAPDVSPGVRFAGNVVTGLGDAAIGATAGTLEDPIGMAKGLPEMVGKSLKTAYSLLPLHMGGPADPRITAEATKEIQERPVEFAMGLLTLIGAAKGGAKLAERGAKTAPGEISTGIPEKSKPVTEPQPVVAQEAGQKYPINQNLSDEISTPPGAVQKPLTAELGAAPETLRNQETSTPSPKVAPKPEPSAFEKVDLERIPADLEVPVKAKRARTGEEVTIKQNAREALTEVDGRLQRYKDLITCLKT